MASQYANMQMAPTSPDARFGILGRFGVNQSTNKKKNKTKTKSNPQKLMCKCWACKWNHLARFWTREKCLKVNRMQQILEWIDGADRAEQRRSSNAPN